MYVVRAKNKELYQLDKKSVVLQLVGDYKTDSLMETFELHPNQFRHRYYLEFENIKTLPFDLIYAILSFLPLPALHIISNGYHTSYYKMLYNDISIHDVDNIRSIYFFNDDNQQYFQENIISNHNNYQLLIFLNSSFQCTYIKKGNSNGHNWKENKLTLLALYEFIYLLLISEGKKVDNVKVKTNLLREKDAYFKTLSFDGNHSKFTKRAFDGFFLSYFYCDSNVV